MSFVEQVGQKTVGRVGETIKARREKYDALRPQFCLNCGTEARKFCPECGQENTPYAVHMSELFRDVWDEFIKADNKFFRTMIPLLFRPGWLTKQYAEGKRARYLSPSRLYLVISALFFYQLSQVRTPHGFNSGVPGRTLGQKIAEDKKRAAQKLADIGKSGPIFHTHPNLKKPVKDVDLTFDVGDNLRIAGRKIDWSQVPDTWAEYDKAQAKRRPSERDDWLTHWIVQRVIKAKSFTLQSYVSHFLETVPKVMFVMMPMFAFLLKILYVRSPRRYVEHFVLSLHVHTVYFVVSSLALLLPTGAAIAFPLIAFPLIALYMAFYGFWAMKVLYGQGVPKTLLKWLLLTWSYGFALQMGFILALLLSFVF